MKRHKLANHGLVAKLPSANDVNFVGTCTCNLLAGLYMQMSLCVGMHGLIYRLSFHYVHSTGSSNLQSSTGKKSHKNALISLAFLTTNYQL